jgi:hypothetical protein
MIRGDHLLHVTGRWGSSLTTINELLLKLSLLLLSLLVDTILIYELSYGGKRGYTGLEFLLKLTWITEWCLQSDEGDHLKNSLIL